MTEKFPLSEREFICTFRYTPIGCWLCHVNVAVNNIVNNNNSYNSGRMTKKKKTNEFLFRIADDTSDHRTN